MPSRELREGILTSDRVDRLAPDAEVFYRRLMSVVDDHQCFDGRPAVILAACFPLRVDKIRVTDICRWLLECESAGLVKMYASKRDGQAEWIKVDDLLAVIDAGDRKPFLFFIDLNPRFRAQRLRWPSPPDTHCDKFLAQHSAKDRSVPGMCPTSAGQMPPEAEAYSKTKTLSGGTEAKSVPPSTTGIEGASPPPNRTVRAHFAGIAGPSPDRLDADYGRVVVPEITAYEDTHGIKDPVILAMAVTEDRKDQSWLGWVRIAAQLRKERGRVNADLAWTETCMSFWAERRSGESVARPGAALTARLKKLLRKP